VRNANGIIQRGVGGRGEDLRDAALLGAGVAAIGGTLWWAWSRSRPHRREAPGRPGDVPSWNFASKDGVGTAVGPEGGAASRVWFTLHRGAFTEVFYPRADRPAVRGLAQIVTDGQGRYSDERHDADHELRWLSEGVPAFELANTCLLGCYRIEKTILGHPRLDVVLQLTRFVPLVGRLEDYRLFTLLNPQLADQGRHNTAWVGRHKGVPMLFAERAGNALALACSVPWSDASAGFIGASDGLRDLRRHGRLVRTYERAEDGNVALIGEVDLVASGGVFVQALGFGSSPSEAGHRARSALLDDFEAVREEYAREWRDWQGALTPPKLDQSSGRDLFRASTAVLRSHEDKSFAGAVVASLSTPWGQARSDEKTGPVGYHVVWPRDLVEIAGGLLAAGAKPDALRVLRYLRATQDGDGHWSQNQLVDGSKVWDSIQLGETALPVLLVDLLSREGVLSPDDRAQFWPMVRAAVGYIAREGPSSQEDRWEDSRGFTPYTLSTLISAQLVAAEMADARGESGLAAYLREAADTWNDNVEFWTYVEDTELARRVGVRGYYLRLAPPDNRGEPAKYDGDLRFWYNPDGRQDHIPWTIVSPDALAYVRFGLRAADDPRILDTVKVIDAITRVELPQGPCWHRYNHDGYGEKADGSPFDDEQGIGRVWPLLTGERAHYELAAGRPAEAARLLHAMEAFANQGGMIPEQVWDSPDIPSKGLFVGRPSGSSMPLAWAHAEYLKLRRSISDGRPFDTPPQVKQRYVVERVRSRIELWRPDHRRRAIPAGKTLRVEVHEPAVVRWGPGDRETPTRDTGLGVHVADLPTSGLAAGESIRFDLTRAGGGRPLLGKDGREVGPDAVRID
jgi:glucoamylase